MIISTLEMSFYPNVTEQDLINSKKLAEQQKNQLVMKIFKKKEFLIKQTYGIKLAESLSPITKKLDEVNQSTKKIGEVNKESDSENENNKRALPNNSNFNESMREMLGPLMNSCSSLKITQEDLGQANILGVPIQISDDDRMRINDRFYDLTTERYKVLSPTSHSGNTMKNENDI